jgi:hypothetical protein
MPQSGKLSSGQAAAENSPRRHPLTSLRYSMADKGWVKQNSKA